MATEFADQTAIRELIDGYADAINRRRFEAVEQFFTADAEWKAGPPFDVTFKGAANIARTLSAMLQSYDVLIQMLSGSVIHVENDRADARTMLQEVVRHPDGGGVQFGIYYDDFIRTPAGWRIAVRHFHPVYRQDAPLTGEAFPPKLD